MFDILSFAILAVVAIGVVERIYRMDKTLRRVNDLLVDLCEHLNVDAGKD